MESRMTGKEEALTALVIAPNRELFGQFSATLPQTRAFQILADLKSYPSEQTLDLRLRQLQPDVVILDVATSLDAAGELIHFISSFRPTVHVIGIHFTADPEAVLQSLRLGATEFLSAPFDIAEQAEATARIRRLSRPESAAAAEKGKVIVLASAKPGSGASTLSTQTAFAIRKMTGKRVLLVDFDLMGGTIAFCLKLNHPYSVLDALEHASRMDPALWSSLVACHGGVDVLPAPESPSTALVDPGRLHDLLEYARLLYDWVLLDTPAVFYRTTLMAVSESDDALLVTTSELPSLHQARRAVQLLNNLGFEKDRFKVIINRVNKRDGIAPADLGKIFACQVFASLPNDYFSLHRVVTLGHPLGFDCELGRAVEDLAGRLTGASKAKRGGRGLVDTSPVLSQT